MRTRLPIKTRIAKLKMLKHQGQNIPIKNDLEDIETNKTSVIPNFLPKILPNDENRKRYKLLKFKVKGSLQCGSYMSYMLCKI